MGALIQIRVGSEDFSIIHRKSQLLASHLSPAYMEEEVPPKAKPRQAAPQQNDVHRAMPKAAPATPMVVSEQREVSTVQPKAASSASMESQAVPKAQPAVAPKAKFPSLPFERNVRTRREWYVGE